MLRTGLQIIIFYIITYSCSYGQCITGNCKNGNGFLRTKDEIQYEGGFKNGKFHGFGDYYDFKNKYSYKGNWANGKKNGFGIEEDYANNTKYEGQWKNDEFNGQGKFVWKDELDVNYEEYEGDWKNKKRTGKGTYKWKNGDTYQGYFFENQLHGEGKLVWFSGGYYEGEFAYDNFNGVGELHHADGTIEKGIFKDDTLFDGETSYSENNLTYSVFSGDTNSTLIIDAAGIIDDNTKKIISDLLWKEYHKTSNTIMVFTIPSLNGKSIEDYANKTFNRLKLGKEGKNNGVLLLVAVNDRKMRMEVGYGLEGVLPDLLTQKIQQQDIIPSFKEGKMSEGILKGVKGILSILQDPKNAELYASNTSSPDESGRSNGTMYLLNFLILLSCINSAYFGQYGRFVFSSIIMAWFSLIITYKDQYGIGFLNSFLIQCVIFYLLYFIIRAIRAGKIKPNKKNSLIYQFFYNNSVKYEASSGGSGGSYSSSGYSSSSSSSYSSSSSSSSWSGGGSSGGGGSSSSW